MIHNSSGNSWTSDPCALRSMNCNAVPRLSWTASQEAMQSEASEACQEGFLVKINACDFITFDFTNSELAFRIDLEPI
eukprot:COSAG02_NODE_5316_length_4444_cov_4.965708_1_plen_78_part_00